MYPALGGLWEASVKCMKTHLKRFLGETNSWPSLLKLRPVWTVGPWCQFPAMVTLWNHWFPNSKATWSSAWHTCVLPIMASMSKSHSPLLEEVVCWVHQCHPQIFKVTPPISQYASWQCKCFYKKTISFPPSGLWGESSISAQGRTGSYESSQSRQVMALTSVR